ncbi:MAG: triphosphoribosyl-dephospho-CoA synthase [Gammaproteobacteria bacterium]
MPSISREQAINAYLDACELELQAFKPGNVSVYANGHEMTVNDFRNSAEVSAGPLTDPAYSLGEKIYYAVKATREKVGCNTNLGIVLLCAPLIQAAYRISEGMTLRRSLSRVLANTTIGDADWAFRAIVTASPGGLGEAPQQDVREAPQVSLTEAMAMAAERDRIAYQYLTDYKDIFDFAIIRYNGTLERLGIRKWAALAVYAGLLSRYPDSHIVRKYGNRFTGWVSAKMAMVENQLSITARPEQLEDMLYRIDAEFKAESINPGTTADMTVATLLAASLERLVGSLN